MKPKLLITLGCSWTKGVGCYKTEVNYNTNKLLSNEEIENLNYIHYQQSYDNFHEFGWPNRLGRKLGFDKVVNLGMAGGSNSSSVKIIYEYLEREDISKYETLIVWLMTEPTRFSFYSDGVLEDFQISQEIRNPMMYEYLKFIKNIKLDPILEQKFYLKTLENFCKVHDIDLITTSWNEAFVDLFQFYRSKTYLHKTPKLMMPPFTKNDDGYLTNWAYCSHPNKNGYEWIANEMVKGIKENHSKWYSGIQNENIEWEFKGIPWVHKPNVI
jgi:hypothetical protein